VTRIPDIQSRKARGEKITMLTAYNAWMARVLAASDAIDLLLVGDSLGMVELGYDTTVPVTMDDMIRHTQAVRRGAPEAIVVADMPFISYHLSVRDAVKNAGRLIQEGGATAVKVEGGSAVLAAVRRIISSGIPVMGHLGLLPQSVHLQGGFRRQATRPEEQAELLSDAAALETAGVFAIVVESIPASLAREASRRLRVPVIGIGSGPYCDGQVLVTNDILGLSSSTPPFAKQYSSLAHDVSKAASAFAREVRSGEFPAVSQERTGHGSAPPGSEQSENPLGGASSPEPVVRVSKERVDVA
jgi:3-methyl-2-oxobutanoate hydroxymethyltransferase